MNRWSITGHRLASGQMAMWRSFLNTPKLVWPAAALLAVLDAGGLYLLASSDPSAAAREARPLAPPLPPEPPPSSTPTMIEPPAVADMLRSGTLIVISKKSQNMFVFSDGALWASTPISTGKRRHETPSGVFPILQKRRYHRSNIYSGAPMPFMQRLTWDGIALHAGWVPGYPASHGCVRVPRAFAASLFKLTNANATTVVIGDDPLDNELHAQQFALTAPLPVRSALAPPPDPAADPVLFRFAHVANKELKMARAMPVPPSGPVTPVPPPVTAAPISPPVVATPAPSPPTTGGQTIQLTAAASQAEAEAHWARLVTSRPDLSRFAKSVEAADVNARRVYRLRLSGADAHSYCTKLRNEGISCLNIS